MSDIDHFGSISDKKRTLAGVAVAKLTHFLKIKGSYLESRITNYSMAQWNDFSAKLVNFLNNYTDMKDLPFWNRLKAPTRIAVAHLFQLKDQDPLRIKIECTREKADLYVLLTGSATMLENKTGEKTELYPGQVVGALDYFDKPKKMKDSATPKVYTITLPKGCLLKLSFSDYYNQVVCPVKESDVKTPKTNAEEARDQISKALDTALSDGVRQFLEDSQILGELITPDIGFPDNTPPNPNIVNRAKKKRKKKRKPEVNKMNGIVMDSENRQCGDKEIPAIASDVKTGHDSMSSIVDNGRLQRGGSFSPAKQALENNSVEGNQNSATSRRQSSVMPQMDNLGATGDGHNGIQRLNSVSSQSLSQPNLQVDVANRSSSQTLRRGDSIGSKKLSKQRSVQSLKRLPSDISKTSTRKLPSRQTSSLRLRGDASSADANDSGTRAGGGDNMGEDEGGLDDYYSGGGLGDDYGDDYGDEDYFEEGGDYDYYEEEAEDMDMMFSPDETGAGSVELADARVYVDEDEDDSEYEYYTDSDSDDASETAGEASSAIASAPTQSRYIMHGSINRNLVIRKDDVRRVFIILEGSVRILVANRSKKVGAIAGRRVKDGIIQGSKNRIMPLMVLGSGAMFSISPEVFTFADGYVPSTGIRKAGNSGFGRKIERDIEHSKTVMNPNDSTTSVAEIDAFEDEDALEKPIYDIILSFQRPTIYISIPYNIFRSAMKDKPGSVTMDLSRSMNQIASSVVDRLEPLLPWLFGGAVVELSPEEEERREREAKRNLWKSRPTQALCEQLSDMKPSGLAGTYFDAIKKSPVREAK